MRASSLLFAVAAAALVCAHAAPSHAQVTEAERAAARQLFKDGDELQRAGKFAEALDKFNRAQQVFSAPTNVLRIAECDAALGRLVESAEAYRAVVRTPLPPNSPPAFQAAVEQARGELAQVEPRVPRLVVTVEPPNVTGEQLQVDGQTVPAALIGEPFPLDPGSHKVLVYAPGFVSSEQAVTLKERETRTVAVMLKPIAGVTYAPGALPGAPPGATTSVPPPAPAPYGSGLEAPPGAAVSTAPPPPAVVEGGNEALKKKSRVALILGAHLGLELPTGQIPLGSGLNPVDLGDASGSGLAVALDGGIRFARQWYVGLTFEYAGLGSGKDITVMEPGASSPSANTGAAGAVLGLIVNPDKVSFFGEVGVQARWLNIGWTDPAGNKQSASYSGAELLLGAGIWIPVGTTFRLLPLATVGLGTFAPPNAVASTSGSTDTSSNPGHAFFMLGLEGAFNVDL